MNGTQYWVKLRLPLELNGLTMQQLTALRRLVTKAYNNGKKDK